MRLIPKRKIFTAEENPATTSAAIQHILQNVDISQSIDDIATDGTRLKAISSNWANGIAIIAYLGL